MALPCIALVVAACTDRSSDVADTTSGAQEATGDSTASMQVALEGSGATFPYPLYARWFNEYARQSGTRINYRSVGSSAGMRELLARTVDFGATDVPMTDAELSAAPSTLVHVPTALGAVAIAYHLSAPARQLRLSGDLIADIFLGRVTRWDHPRLAALNPGVTLPPDSIRVVYRGDGGGTTYILSDYLSRVSADWADGPGRTRDVRWPVGTSAGSGNEGMAGHIRQTPGSIGYLEAVYARQNRLSIARIRNRAGQFVSPMAFEIASAAVAPPAASLRRSLVDAPAPYAYPMASFTWMVFSPQSIGATKTGLIADFLRWAVADGGDIASALGYVPLPTETADRVLHQLDELAIPRAVRDR